MRQKRNLLGARTNKLLNDFQDARNTIAEQWTQKLQGLKLACSTGCYHCCSLIVRVHFLEGILIARELLAAEQHVALAAAEDHARLVEQFRIKYLLAEGEMMPPEDFNVLWVEHWAEQHIFCPFLINGLCSIYPLRPLTCRVHYAIDSRIPCMTPNSMVKVADATQPHKDCLALAVQLNTAMGWEPLIVPAPLSVAVTWGKRYALGEDIPEIQKQG